MGRPTSWLLKSTFSLLLLILSHCLTARVMGPRGGGCWTPPSKVRRPVCTQSIAEMQIEIFNVGQKKKKKKVKGCVDFNGNDSVIHVALTQRVT